MIKRSPTKPVRVVPPMMEEQEVSTITLQEWLDREETVSHLLFCKGKEEGIDKSYKSFKNCTFQHQTFSECKFRSSQLSDVRFENCDLSNISFAESSLYLVALFLCDLDLHNVRLLQGSVRCVGGRLTSFVFFQFLVDFEVQIHRLGRPAF